MQKILATAFYPGTFERKGSGSRKLNDLETREERILVVVIKMQDTFLTFFVECLLKKEQNEILKG